MARLPWRRGDQTDKAAPPRATMVPLADVLAAIQQTGQTAAPPNPMERPEEWLTLPFNPGNPIYPAPINPARTDTDRPEPRQWQYPVAWNLNVTDGRLIPWKTLRDAADGPIVRQCITHRQKELTGLDWDITISQGALEEAEAAGLGRAEATQRLQRELAPHIKRLVEFWQTPDVEQGLEFSDWLWQVVEEQLVLDAVAIYPRYTYGGDLVALRTVDGSTIKPLLNDHGGRPQPPHPAYQQVLYGFPRGEFTADMDADGGTPGLAADQLIYRRRGVRTWTPYGFSPTEQALIDVDLYLKRHGWMRSEYDEGTAPEIVLRILEGAPDRWTPRQIREYERALNDDLAGQTGERLRMRMLPPGTEPATLPSIPERYKPEYDLHLIKLVASHFAVPITELGFTEAKGLGNSGLHEGQAEINYRAGLLPEARWWQRLFTRISRIHLGAPPELEFKFLGLDEEDEQDSDAIADARVKSGRMTINEDRDRLGLPRFPFPEADKPAIFTGTGVTFLEGAGEAAEAARQALAQGKPPVGGAQTSPVGGDGEGEEGGGQADTAKAELAAFRRWARKRTDPKRPFEFTADRALLVKLAPDLADDDRVRFKAADAGPKGWPGWDRDEALTAHYMAVIRRALADAVDVERLARDWLNRSIRKDDNPYPYTVPPATGGATGGSAQAAQQWADTAGVLTDLTGALNPVLTDAWTEAWALGQQAAASFFSDTGVDWSDWKPGNPAAARTLADGAKGLQDLLDHYGVDTIRSIAKTRMGELADLLAEALDEGWSTDHLARQLHDVLDDPGRAEMVARTEVARAQSQATADTYRGASVQRVEWITSPTDACPICVANAEESPVRLGQDFRGGQDAPPQHPNCRCALVPVIPGMSSGRKPSEPEPEADTEPLTGDDAYGAVPGRRDDAIPDDAARALYGYSGGEYAWINAYLRGRTMPYGTDEERLAEVKAAVAAMRRGFAAAPALAHPIEVWRGLGDVDALFGPVGSRVGRTFRDKAFTSTSTSQARAAHFGRTQVRITVPAGTRVIALGREEMEVLLRAGSRFRVVSDQMVGDNRRIDLELRP